MSVTKILSGKTVSESVYAALIPRISTLKSLGIIPGLAVVIVGDDPASQVYVRNKTRRFTSMNLFTETFRYGESVTQDELLVKIDHLNEDDRFHGILVQLPLPKQVDSGVLIDRISAAKDVDGFSPENLGRLTAGKPRYIPCTPKGIMKILDYYDIPLNGRHVVVLGRSNIVGRPVSILTSLKTAYANATTTLCHSGTKDIRNYSKMADVIVVAMGVPEFVDDSYIKPGVALVDVGINRVEDDSEKGYRLVGDIDYDSVQGIASAITPVPGGVGPMTIAMLVENTVEAAEHLLQKLPDTLA